MYNQSGVMSCHMTWFTLSRLHQFNAIIFISDLLIKHWISPLIDGKSTFLFVFLCLDTSPQRNKTLPPTNTYPNQLYKYWSISAHIHLLKPNSLWTNMVSDWMCFSQICENIRNCQKSCYFSNYFCGYT